MEKNKTDYDKVETVSIRVNGYLKLTFQGNWWVPRLNTPSLSQNTSNQKIL